MFKHDGVPAVDVLDCDVDGKVCGGARRWRGSCAKRARVNSGTGRRHVEEPRPWHHNAAVRRSKSVDRVILHQLEEAAGHRDAKRPHSIEGAGIAVERPITDGALEGPTVPLTRQGWGPWRSTLRLHGARAQRPCELGVRDRQNASRQESAVECSKPIPGVVMKPLWAILEGHWPKGRWLPPARRSAAATSQQTRGMSDPQARRRLGPPAAGEQAHPYWCSNPSPSALRAGKAHGVLPCVLWRPPAARASWTGARRRVVEGPRQCHARLARATHPSYHRLPRIHQPRARHGITRSVSADPWCIGQLGWLGALTDVPLT